MTLRQRLAVALVLIVAAFASPAAAQSMLGTWDVPCCNGAYRFTIQVTADDGQNFSGAMIDQATGRQDSTVRGRYGAGSVSFDRSGAWGVQHWTATLSSQGGRLLMVGGRWSGTGAGPGVSPEFSGVQTSRGQAAAPVARGMLGRWDVPCCNGAYRFTIQVTADDGQNFSGAMIDQATGRQDSTVSGRYGAGRVTFDRSGAWGVQHWTASLVIDGGRLRMVGGRWNGTGAVSGASLEFSGTRVGD